MDEHTDYGAMQAFKYYIATAMWAHQVGDDSLTQEMQTKDCEGCKVFMETYRDAVKNETLWSEFSLQEVKSETLPTESKLYDLQVNYNFTTTPHMRPHESGGPLEEVGELEYATAGGMKWIDGHWKVAGLSTKWGPDVFTY